jgi:hypothetical protein
MAIHAPSSDPVGINPKKFCAVCKNALDDLGHCETLGCLEHWSYPPARLRQRVHESTCCAGVDVPGVGKSHSSDFPVGDPLPAEDKEGWAELLGRIVQFAEDARELARERIGIDNWRSFSVADWPAAPPTMCHECKTLSVAGEISHKPTCRVGRVMGFSLGLNTTSDKKEIAQEEGLPRVEAGTPPRVDEWEFDEPWKAKEFNSGERIMSCVNRILIERHFCDGRATGEEFERIAACVNYCAGISTDTLLRCAPPKPEAKK